MAQILVQLQKPNLVEQEIESGQTKSFPSNNYSIDDQLLSYELDSTSLLEFIQKLKSESKIPMYYSIANELLNRNSTFLSLSNTYLPLNQSKEEVINFNCDKTEDENIQENYEKIELKDQSHCRTSEKSTTDNIVQFSIPILSNVPQFNTNPNILISALKHTNAIGTRKKKVRFADSVGGELTQVQYIQSLIDDDDSEDFLLEKKNSCLRKTPNSEYKSFPFDLVSTSKQISDIQLPRTFFCLFRQPNSKHSDIYLNEVGKSHIKLGYANIRLKSSPIGEQYLYGIISVTNDNYQKNVTIKYTFNRWKDIYEYKAQYCYHLNEFCNIDQFEFSIDIPHDIDRIDLVLRYQVNGQEYWDNNEEKNYTLETKSTCTTQDYDSNEIKFY